MGAVPGGVSSGAQQMLKTRLACERRGAKGCGFTASKGLPDGSDGEAPACNAGDWVHCIHSKKAAVIANLKYAPLFMIQIHAAASKGQIKMKKKKKTVVEIVPPVWVLSRFSHVRHLGLHGL